MIVNPDHSPAHRARRCIVLRLDHLLSNLESLSQRLRASLAEVLSESVADAIHEAISHVLTGGALPALSGPREYDQYRRDYDRAYNPEQERDGYEYERRWEEQSESDREPEPETEATRLPCSRWHLAILACVQTMAWWLRQRSGAWALLGALGVGATVGLVAYLVGPLFGAISVAGGAILALLALADGSLLSISRLRQVLANE